jgi:predicted metal-dependent hydrolase
VAGLVQLVLDFFSPTPSASKDSSARALPSQTAVSPADLTPPDTGSPKTDGARLPRELQLLEHPQASRRIQLRGTTVLYLFRRSRRRTIGMAVGPEGLEVSAPRWVPLGEIEAALLEKQDWILRKLHDMQAHQQRLQGLRIDWRDGVELPYLGRGLRVVLAPDHPFRERGAQLLSLTPEEPGAPAHQLRVGLPHHATAQQLRDAVQAWLMRRAREHFTERLQHFAPRLGVQWRKLSLSSAATRWGSASADGSIRLNWRLIHFKPEVIDYVVVHELSHLQVMNHSPAFWDTVGQVMPDYAERRAQLKDEAIPRWD